MNKLLQYPLTKRLCFIPKQNYLSDTIKKIYLDYVYRDNINDINVYNS